MEVGNDGEEVTTADEYKLLNISMFGFKDSARSLIAGIALIKLC